MRRPQFRQVEKILRLVTAELILKDIDLGQYGRHHERRRKKVLMRANALIDKVADWRKERAAKKAAGGGL